MASGDSSRNDSKRLTPPCEARTRQVKSRLVTPWVAVGSLVLASGAMTSPAVGSLAVPGQAGSGRALASRD